MPWLSGYRSTPPDLAERAFVRDISEPRRAENALRMSEERWRKVFENSPIGIVICDADQRYTAVNPAFQKMVGYTEEELLTLGPRDITHEEDRGITNTILWEFNECQRLTAQMEQRYRHKDGAVIWANVSSSFIPATDTTPAFAAAVIVDITENKLTNEKLRESELNLRMMTETIPEMLWSATPDGAVDYCNTRVLDYTGLPIEDMKGAGWTKAIHPDDAEAMARTWISSVSSGAPFRFEFRGLRAADQMYRWCVSSALPLLDAERRVAKWYGTIVDWHDWKEARETLHNMQVELERAARVMTVGQLAASIAHEINQPLAAIATNSETCLRWLAEETLNPAKARAAVMRVLRDGRRAGDVIARDRALLVKKGLERTLVNVNDVVRDVLTFLNSELRNRHVSVNTDLLADLPSVVGDRVQLQQVVLNLVVNGMEAMATTETGSRVPEIKSRLHDCRDLLVLVRDSGVGFAPADQIFMPFFTTKEGGMGIGLSICRSIIEAHGGGLWAMRASPKGAIFLNLRYRLRIDAIHDWRPRSCHRH